MNRPSFASAEAAVLSAVSEEAALSEEVAAVVTLLRKNIAQNTRATTATMPTQMPAFGPLPNFLPAGMRLRISRTMAMSRMLSTMASRMSQ